MKKILDSTELCDNLTEEIIDEMTAFNMTPKVSIIRFGNRPADTVYERGILKSSQKLGVEVDINRLDEKTPQEEVLKLIKKINEDRNIGGLLMLRPYPKNFDEDVINFTVSVNKDLDCVNPINKAKVYSGEVDRFIPLAPKAAVKLLDYYGVDLEGKNCVIINHSDVVGKPLEMILLKRWATVTMCHIKTKDLKKHTQNADIVFTAMGVNDLLDESYFNENSIVIDIGISKNKLGKMVGDLSDEGAKQKVRAYSPVPNGVGSITNLLLLQSALRYYR